jgi:hypothetical protein
MMKIARLVSGGQSGVDRAALDVALALGIPCGGWCPKGRKAEDGERYPLKETPSAGYSQRTRWNVRDADGTLILTWGAKLLAIVDRKGDAHVAWWTAPPASSNGRSRTARKRVYHLVFNRHSVDS